MAKMKLLITDNIDEKELKPLDRYFQIEKKVGLSSEELIKHIANYHCLITRSSTAIPQKIIERAKNLKLICRAGIGVDNIDIFTATKKGIGVINAPYGNALVTAEHTIGLLFALFRHIPSAVADLKAGVWGKQKYIGNQISGKVLGIVGYGNVGREVYRIASGVGMKVVVCEPYTTLPKKIQKMTFEELLKTSDVISFHVPLTYLTQKMINKYTIRLCKRGAYIINCSRGGVVDDEAIIWGLKSGLIGGFAVDVFTSEPTPNKKLLKMDQVIATPHIAGSTYESQKESIKEVVSGICEYFEGKLPANLLNPQVFKKKKERPVSFSEYDAVIFDCDSTLSEIEGIDELAYLLGKKEEIAQLTRLAMEGKMDFESVYEKRLNILKPHKSLVEKIGKLYLDSLIADTREVIEALKLAGKKVYIISGGFSSALNKLGKELGVSEKNIFGNDLFFDNKGNYVSYIEGPLRRNHGKLQIIRQIKGRKIMVGDSLTDLETKECVDLFVGFGGVVKREIVEKESELYLYCKSLLPVLVLSIGVNGCQKLLKTKYRKLIGKGLDLMFHPKHVKKSRIVARKFSEFKKLAYY